MHARMQASLASVRVRGARARACTVDAAATFVRHPAPRRGCVAVARGRLQRQPVQRAACKRVAALGAERE
jgi:hypothetical protein